MGPGGEAWVRGWLADGWIGYATVFRVPDMGHAVAVLGAGDDGVLLMDPLSGHVTEPWDWFLGIGPGRYGCHYSRAGTGCERAGLRLLAPHGGDSCALSAQLLCRLSARRAPRFRASTPTIGPSGSSLVERGNDHRDHAFGCRTLSRSDRPGWRLRHRCTR